jgi:carbonic anhydrase
VTRGVMRQGRGRRDAGLQLGCLLLLLSTPLHAATSLCDTGRHQSPIDIRATQQRALPALEFAYRPAPLKVANDGHTLRVRFPAGSELQIGSQHYQLTQLHFHMLRQPLEVSPAQLARWREHFADNARAVQPLNGRTVLESR